MLNPESVIVRNPNHLVYKLIKTVGFLKNFGGIEYLMKAS